MKIHTDTPQEDVQIQIIPLIDVIFCILTFFILAALQFTRQQAINIDLPKASTGTTLPGLSDNRFREMLVVTIGPTGQTFIDQRSVDRSTLAQALQTYIVQNPDGMLVLNASPNAFYNDVIQVLDVMRAVGGNRVALATVPTTSPSPNSGTNPLQPGVDPIPSPGATFNPFNPFETSPGSVPGATGNPLTPEGTVSPSPSPNP